LGQFLGAYAAEFRDLKISPEKLFEVLAEHRKPAYTARRFLITDAYAWRSVQ